MGGKPVDDTSRPGVAGKEVRRFGPRAGGRRFQLNTTRSAALVELSSYKRKHDFRLSIDKDEGAGGRKDGLDADPGPEHLDQLPSPLALGQAELPDSTH